jgi:hypothetical protein
LSSVYSGNGGCWQGGQEGVYRQGSPAQHRTAGP